MSFATRGYARLLLVSILGLSGACATEPTPPPGDAGRCCSPVDAPGTDAGPQPDTGPRPDGGPPIDAPPAPGDAVTLSFGPDPVAVGGERTICVVLDAGNDVARDVRAIATHLPAGSHHMIVYRTTDPLQATPETCFPFAGAGDAVFIAESVDAQVVYPSDAALEFEPHQHVRLEIHEVNYTGAPLDVRASVSFEYYPLGGSARTPVRFRFTGNMALSLPARSETTVTSFHTLPDGARIFGLTSHTHALGTYTSIHLGTSETAFTTLLHESLDWANPPLTTFDPPLEPAPSEGLRLQCTFTNPTDATVRFGLDFADEMCFLWAYYY